MECNIKMQLASSIGLLSFHHPSIIFHSIDEAWLSVCASGSFRLGLAASHVMEFCNLLGLRLMDKQSLDWFGTISVVDL